MFDNYSLYMLIICKWLDIFRVLLLGLDFSFLDTMYICISIGAYSFGCLSRPIIACCTYVWDSICIHMCSSSHVYIKISACVHDDTQIICVDQTYHQNIWPVFLEMDANGYTGILRVGTSQPKVTHKWLTTLFMSPPAYFCGVVPNILNQGARRLAIPHKQCMFNLSL